MAPNNEHYDTQEYAGDRASRTHRTMQRMPDEDRSTRSDIQDSITGSQAATLAPEVRMGDDLVIGDTPNWAGFDSQQLYAFATQNNSPTSADALGRTFNTGGNGLVEAANGLLDAVTRLDGAWSGTAADSARAALAPLAQAAGQAGQTAQMMGVQMSRQSVAATEVRKLPPPQEFDQTQSLNAMLAGGPAAMRADLKVQQEAADAVKREQISYLNAYTQAMSSVDAHTPSFVPPPVGRINPGDGGGSRVTGGPVPFSGTTGGFDQGTSTGAPSGGYVGIDPRAGAGLVGEPGSTDGDNVTLPGTLPGTNTAGYTPGTTAPVSPSVPVGGGPAVPPSAGAGGFGGAFGNFGGASTGQGTGQGAGAGQGAKPATSGTGAGPRGPIPTGMAGRGAGAMGGTGARGGRHNGEEDDEHDRPSYLVEGDPDGAFGNDQLTAPSVIGGDGDD
ncbi:MAG TPA: hypothetical protein VNP92_15605 [Actinophytocola sp.]|nr:hypothetical protein [Actinophytocola sp.]